MATTAAATTTTTRNRNNDATNPNNNEFEAASLLLWGRSNKRRPRPVPVPQETQVDGGDVIVATNNTNASIGEHDETEIQLGNQSNSDSAGTPSSSSSSSSLRTRYYLHMSFFCHLLIQLLNAFVQQHHLDPLKGGSMYFLYIFLCYGPVLLLCLWMAQWIQNLVAKRYFHLTEEETFSVILWPFGGLSMHQTQNVSQDIKLAATIPSVHVLLTLIWMGIYFAITAGQVTTETINSSSMFNHISSFSSFRGIMTNICVQSIYINLSLTGVNLLIPCYPSTASSLYAGLFFCCGPSKQRQQQTAPTSSQIILSSVSLKQIAISADCFGLIMSTILLAVGCYETFYHDDYAQGIGVFLFLNSFVLVYFAIRRLRKQHHHDSFTNKHDLVGRPCYHNNSNNTSTQTHHENNSNYNTRENNCSSGNETFKAGRQKDGIETQQQQQQQQNNTQSRTNKHVNTNSDNVSPNTPPSGKHGAADLV